ncbi:hypothetical protein, partial [Streptomyces sp. UH6]|uniref:hypothetical protein n=1 Tax=Streptomyces sp. UH6 TaxID=2748379 RepID=UPI0015D4863D
MVDGSDGWLIGVPAARSVVVRSAGAIGGTVCVVRCRPLGRVVGPSHREVVRDVPAGEPFPADAHGRNLGIDPHRRNLR